MKKLCLSIDLKEQIRQHCLDSYPEEACGLLIGRHDVTGEEIVTKVISSPNLSDHPDRSFEIDPSLIIHHQKEGRRGDDKILGHYHSHPNGRAVPSVRDQSQNYDADLIWVIVEVTRAGCQDMKAYATAKNAVLNAAFKSGQLTAIPIDLWTDPQPAGTV